MKQEQQPNQLGTAADMDFKEMMTGLFNVDFLSEDELETICQAAEMYANARVIKYQQPSSPSLEGANIRLLISQAIAHTLVIDNKQSIHRAVEKIINILSDLRQLPSIKEGWIDVKEMTDAQCLEAANLLGNASHLSEESRVRQFRELMSGLFYRQTNLSGLQWFKLFQYFESNRINPTS